MSVTVVSTVFVTVLRLSQRNSQLEAESAQCHRELAELRTKCDELRRQCEELVLADTDKMAVEKHINTLAAHKQCVSA